MCVRSTLQIAMHLISCVYLLHVIFTIRYTYCLAYAKSCLVMYSVHLLPSWAFELLVPLRYFCVIFAYALLPHVFCVLSTLYCCMWFTTRLCRSGGNTAHCTAPFCVACAKTCAYRHSQYCFNIVMCLVSTRYYLPPKNVF